MTNHAVVLLMVARNPRSTLRELAAAVGITERAVSAIVGDLEDAGYIIAAKVGRGKRYELDLSKPLRHPVVAVLPVGDLLGALGDVRKRES